MLAGSKRRGNVGKPTSAAPGEQTVMKIRHVVRGRCNPENADGIIRYTYSMAHAQLRLGHDVAVYGLQSRVISPELLSREGLRVFAFPHTTNPFSLHPGIRRQLDIEGEDVDIVHIQVPHDPAMYSLSRELVARDIPYMISPHGMWEKEALDRHRLRKKAYKLMFDNRMCRGAVGVHATSMAELDSIRRYTPGMESFYVRNSVDLTRMGEPVGDGSFWQSEYGVKAGDRVFVSLGRLDPFQKGLDVLLDAWSRLPDGLEARLALIGPFWRGNKSEIRQLVANAGLGDRVILTGPLYGEPKYRALNEAACYIQVSRYEGTPIAVLEALACRLPAILTPGTNLDLIVEDHNAGWGVPLEPEAIARRIEEASRLPKGELETRGAAARALVEERHSLDRAASRIVEAYAASLSGANFVDDD